MLPTGIGVDCEKLEKIANCLCVWVSVFSPKKNLLFLCSLLLGTS